MVNKKGYIKTVEAVIAVIMIIIISFTLIPQHVERQPDPPLSLQGAMGFINEKIEFNESLRRGIVTEEYGIETSITPIIKLNKPWNYDFTCAVCSSTGTCIIDTPLKQNVYVSDIFIASSEMTQNPKIVRIWFWEALRGADPAEYKEQLGCWDLCYSSINKCYQK